MIDSMQESITWGVWSCLSRLEVELLHLLVSQALKCSWVRRYLLQCILTSGMAVSSAMNMPIQTDLLLSVYSWWQNQYQKPLKVLSSSLSRASNLSGLHDPLRKQPSRREEHSETGNALPTTSSTLTWIQHKSVDAVRTNWLLVQRTATLGVPQCAASHGSHPHKFFI